MSCAHVGVSGRTDPSRAPGADTCSRSDCRLRQRVTTRKGGDVVRPRRRYLAGVDSPVREPSLHPESTVDAASRRSRDVNAGSPGRPRADGVGDRDRDLDWPALLRTYLAGSAQEAVVLRRARPRRPSAQQPRRTRVYAFSWALPHRLLAFVGDEVRVRRAGGDKCLRSIRLAGPGGRGRLVVGDGSGTQSGSYGSQSRVGIGGSFART